MTPAERVAFIRQQFGDTSANFVGEGEIYNYLSDAETLLSFYVNCTETTATDTSVASAREYDKPTRCHEILRVTWNDVKLKKIDMREKDAVEQTTYGFTGDEGDPVYYYEYGDKIGLSPIPDTAETIKFWYVQYPARLTAASASFTVDVRFEPFLDNYVLYRMYLKDNMNQEAQNYWNLWQEGLRGAKHLWESERDSDRFYVVKTEDNNNETVIGII